MSDTQQANGLPADREAAVQAGLAHFQTVAAERDEARAIVVRIKDELGDVIARLKSDIAAHKVANEAMAAQLNIMESRIISLTAVRDQAVADRAAYEALYVSLYAQFRAFQIPAAPLVREVDEPEIAAIGGA